MLGLYIASLAFSAGSVVAQFISPPTDLITATGYANVTVRYKEVPAGTCELDPEVKSFSGYSDVDTDQHIFWWFFEARMVDPKTAPLTVWINGGPGSSSMVGLFMEHGPCRISSEFNVLSNPYSWSNVSNILYIDQPTTVGFSYSQTIPGYLAASFGDLLVPLDNESCPEYVTALNDGSRCGTFSALNVTLTANSTPAAAPNFWKTLQGFMGVFPQYSENGVNIATESYGGHYGPVFADYILSQNRLGIPGTYEIDLRNLLIGNGWFIPLLQHQSFYNFTQSTGNTYDLEILDDTESAGLYSSLYQPGGCFDMLRNCSSEQTDSSNLVCRAANNYCNSLVLTAIDASGRDYYDIRELVPDPFPESYFVDYLNRIDVLEAVGAYQNFTNLSVLTNTAFSFTGDAARDFDTKGTVNRLIEAGVQVMMFFGDSDYICNWMAGQAVADHIDPPEYSSSGFVNISSCDGTVHGQVRQSGSFSFVRIYESGHLVPYYQPLAALEIFKRMINGKDIATGTMDVDAGYTTVGPLESEYREGNETVQWEPVPFCATYSPSLNKPDPTSLQCDASALGQPQRSIREFSQPFAALGVDLELFKKFGLPA